MAKTMTLAEAAKALGVSVNATQAEVKKAFRALAIKCHPDKVPPEEKERAQELFMKINEAFKVFQKHFESQNTNTGQSQGGNSGAQSPNPGAQRPNPGNQRPPHNPTGNSANGNAHTDPIIKMFWEEYQRASKMQEDFVNNTLKPLHEKIATIENALRQAMDSKRLDDRLKYAEELAHQLRILQMRISEANLYYDLKKTAEEKYYQAVAARQTRYHDTSGRE